MVWYQKFEYAVGHWLQKTAEHVFGSVLCSPGCFSLFRGTALMDDNVLKRYTTTASRASEYVQYDQGWHRSACSRLFLLCLSFAPCFSSLTISVFFFCVLFVRVSRGGSLAVHSVTAAGLARGIQRCLRCIHQLTTGVQRVLQPEETMGTIHTG